MLQYNSRLHSSCLVLINRALIIGYASAFVSSSSQLPLLFTGRHVQYLHHGVGGKVDGNVVPSTTRSAGSELDERLLRRKHYHLTILLPAYNEKDRIGNTLSSYMNYMSKTPVYQHQYQTLQNSTMLCTNLVSGSVSVLVVDDGSNDGTAEFIRGRSWLSEQAVPTEEGDHIQESTCWNVDPKVNVITLPHNSGKGAAIERGMMALPSSFDHGISCNINDGETHYLDKSVVSLVLVADADGSGDISCVDGMLRCLEEILSNSVSSTKWTEQNNHGNQFPAMVVGYRQNLVPKSPFRAFLSHGFRTSVSLVFIGKDLGVRDTQCGFKLMTPSAGQILYNRLNLRRWSHDVEVIHRARLLEMPVGECGVVWVDKDGSKLIAKKTDALFASLAMFGEIANMRFQYALGTWTVKAEWNGLD